MIIGRASSVHVHWDSGVISLDSFFEGGDTFVELAGILNESVEFIIIFKLISSSFKVSNLWFAETLGEVVPVLISKSQIYDGLSVLHVNIIVVVLEELGGSLLNQDSREYLRIGSRDYINKKLINLIIILLTEYVFSSGSSDHIEKIKSLPEHWSH